MAARPLLAWLLARQVSGLKPAVLFLNALASLLRRRKRELPVAHIPAAFGDQPPPVDVAFYQPLTQLDAGYRLYAGVADHRDPDVSRIALRLFETTSGRRAEAVSTACGMGREPLKLATSAVSVCRTLVDAPYPLTETRRDNGPAIRLGQL